MANSADQDMINRRCMRVTLAHLRAAVLLLCGFGLAACSSLGGLFGSTQPQPGQVGSVQGFLGAAIADEPLAALAGRDTLSAGGNAMDAVAAMMTTLWVTYPSRAGLGGGGACLVYFAKADSPNQGVPDAIVFPATAPIGGGAGQRPAAVPMMARGLFLMHARFGSLPLETYLGAAEQIARFGVGTSRALATDLGIVGRALLADATSRQVFAPTGALLAEGDSLRQPELAGTLATLRVAGIGDLYQGSIARRIEEFSPQSGGPLTVEQLRSALPKLVAPLLVRVGRDTAAFLPPPADGGLAAAAAFKALLASPNDVAGADARAQAVAAAWRAGGVTTDALLNAGANAAYPLPSLPASTSLVAADRNGNAVACALSMNNLFGTGRFIPDLGILAAASPDLVPPPLLSAAIVWNENIRSLRAAVASSGQAGAPIATAFGLSNTLRTLQPMATPVPDPGRANVFACGRYLPAESASCLWATDPRGHGLAAGGT
jgi:gamma-glutamyltranspeptidase/glutathione hydrolase